MRVVVSGLCLALLVVVSASKCTDIFDGYGQKLSYPNWFDWNHKDYLALQEECLSIKGCYWCLNQLPDGKHYVTCHNKPVQRSIACGEESHARHRAAKLCGGELCDCVGDGIAQLQGEERKLAADEVARLGDEVDDFRTSRELLEAFKETEYGARLEERKAQEDGLLLQHVQGEVAPLPSVLDTLADLPAIIQEAIDQCDDEILGPTLENEVEKYQAIARSETRSFGREISRMAASFSSVKKTNWLVSCSYPVAVRDQDSYAQWLTYYLLAILRELKLDEVDINEDAKEGPGVKRCDLFVLTDLLRLGSFHILGGLHEYFIQRAKFILDHKYHAAAQAQAQVVAAEDNEAEVDNPAAPAAVAAVEDADGLDNEAAKAEAMADEKVANFLVVDCPIDLNKVNPAWEQSVQKALEHVHYDQWVSACCARDFGVSIREIVGQMRKDGDAELTGLPCSVRMVRN